MPTATDLFSDPDFRALAPEQQAVMRQRVFERVIAADPDFAALDPQDQARIRIRTTGEGVEKGIGQTRFSTAEDDERDIRRTLAGTQIVPSDEFEQATDKPEAPDPLLADLLKRAGGAALTGIEAVSQFFPSQLAKRGLRAAGVEPREAIKGILRATIGRPAAPEEIPERDIEAELAALPPALRNSPTFQARMERAIASPGRTPEDTEESAAQLVELAAEFGVDVGALKALSAIPGAFRSLRGGRPAGPTTEAPPPIRRTTPRPVQPEPSLAVVPPAGATPSPGPTPRPATPGPAAPPLAPRPRAVEAPAPTPPAAPAARGTLYPVESNIRVKTPDGDALLLEIEPAATGGMESSRVRVLFPGRGPREYGFADVQMPAGVKLDTAPAPTAPRPAPEPTLAPSIVQPELPTAQTPPRPAPVPQPVSPAPRPTAPRPSPQPQATAPETLRAISTADNETLAALDELAIEGGMTPVAIARAKAPDLLVKTGGEPLSLADTGKPVSIMAHRGTGRQAVESVYAPGINKPILGDAEYFSPSEDVARAFGPNIESRDISLRSPLVLDSDKAVSRFMGNRPAPMRQEEIGKFYGELRAKADKAGHDGVIVNIPRHAAMNARGDSIKRLREHFGETQIVAFRERAARELPTVVKPAVPAAEGVPIPPRPAGAPIAAVQRPNAPPSPATVEQAPAGGIVQFAPEELRVDASRFQFKGQTDVEGVSERLRGVSKWDERLQGLIVVWEDTSGQRFIADGHQRLALAKRLQSEGKGPIRLNGILLREADGIAAPHARAIAAAKNIAEGTGDAVDAARVLRQSANVEGLPPLPPRSALVRDSQGLARLGDEAFNIIEGGEVPANYGAIVGRLVDDPPLQTSIIKLLQKTQPDNAAQAESIIRQAISLPVERQATLSLFGEQEIAETLFVERAKILDRAIKELRRDKRTFGLLVQRGEQIEGAGNVLAQGKNQAILTESEKAIDALNVLANRSGAISDALTAAAKRAKETGKLDQPTREFIEAVRGTIARGDFDRIYAGAGGRAGEAVPDIPGAQAQPGAGAAGEVGEALFKRRRVPAPDPNQPEMFQVERRVPDSMIPSGPKAFEETPLGRAATEATNAEIRQRQGKLFGPKAPDGESYFKTPPPQPSSSPLDPSPVPRGPAGAQEILRRSEIRERLRAILDIPTRIGRIKGGRGAVGEYNPSARVIRLRDPNDLATFGHEVGHDLHAIFFGGLTGEGRLSARPLAAFSDELVRLGKQSPRGRQLVEGFAEFVEMYVQDAKAAMGAAPRFGAFFEQTLQRNAPDVWRALRTFADDFKRWNAQPAASKVRSMIRSDIPDRPVLPSWDRLQAAAIDDLHFLKKAVNEMARGKRLDFEDNAYILARLSRSWTDKAAVFVEHGPRHFTTFQPTGAKPLKEIVRSVPANEIDDFRAYLVARRAKELNARGIKSGIDTKDAEAALRELDRPSLRSAAAELDEYNDAILRYAVDSGTMSEAQYARIKSLNRAYAPFYRMMDLSDQGEKALRTVGGSLYGNPIKAIRGSGREIIDPLEGIIKNTYAVIHWVEDNRVRQALVELAEQTQGFGKWIDKVPPRLRALDVRPKDVRKILEAAGLDDVPKELLDTLFSLFRPTQLKMAPNEFRVLRDGRAEHYLAAPALMDALRMLDRPGLNSFVSLLAAPGRSLRAGATLTPEFGVRNPFRDQWTASIQSNYGYLIGIDFFRGLFHLAKRDELYKSWKMAGGAQAALVSMDRTKTVKTLNSLMEGPWAKVANVVRHPIDSLRMVSEFGENATRMGEFVRGVAKEGARKEGLLRAAFSSRELTTDFALRGTTTREISALTAFWNARLQGVAQMVSTFRNKPGQAVAIGAASITLPSVGLWLRNHDDPRWEMLPQWQKDMAWIVFTRKIDRAAWENADAEARERMVEEAGPIWRLPKPHTYGIIFGTIPEKVLEYLKGTDPEAIKEIAGVMGREVPALDPVALVEGRWGEVAAPSIPTAGLPLWENFANWSLFFQRPVVPRGLELNVPPGLQAGAHTPEIYKMVGQFADISPSKIQNLVRGYFGGLGEMAVETASLPFDGREKDRTLADIPVARGFVSRFPSSQAAPIEKFYRDFEANRREARGAMHVLRQGGEIAGEENLRVASIRMALDKSLARIAKDLGELGQAIGAAERDTSLSPEERRRRIGQISLTRIELAMQGNLLLQQVRGLGRVRYSTAPKEPPAK